jgi:hypothetical protein
LGLRNPTGNDKRRTGEHKQQYVGIDLHWRRSVIVRRNGAGETLETVRIDNDPVNLAAELVIVAGTPPGRSGYTNMLRVHRLGEPV